MTAKPQLALVAFLALAAFASAQEISSPFKRVVEAPPQQQQAAPPTALDAFEFNGFMTLDGKARVSVFDTKNRRNYWLEEKGAAIDGLVLRRFDRDSKSINIALGTVSKTLQLKDASILSLKLPTAAPPPPSIPGAPQTAIDNVASGPDVNRRQESDEEVRERMRKMAEEIRRRRALRRQMIEERNNANSESSQ